MSAEYNFNFDWNRISTLGKVKVLVEQVVGAPSQEAINTAVADYIEAHPGSLSPLSAATKAALLQIAEKVAYVDANGQGYYDALDAALSAKALLSITAVYTQSGTVYDTDTLDSLKADLVVTAYYDDGTTADVTSAAVLSGTLTEGTSTITATYQEKTATFDVTVSQGYRTATLSDIVSKVGFSGLACTNGTFTATSAQSFSVAMFDQSIKSVKRASHADSSSAGWIIFAKNNNGSFYGCDGSLNLWIFAPSGTTKYTATKDASIASISGSSASPNYECRMSLVDGSLIVTGTSLDGASTATLTITNANCIGWWASNYKIAYGVNMEVLR